MELYSFQVVLQTNLVPANKCTFSYAPRTSRLVSLLKERELRKLNTSFRSNAISCDGNIKTEPFADELCLSDGNDCRSINDESYQGFNNAPSDETESKEKKPTKQRLLVVANRLPVSAVRKGEDSWELKMSVGGLVSALLGMKEFEATWIGWAGIDVPDKIGQEALTKALAKKGCIPVFLDEDTAEKYYNGYCNNILWPVFHYLGLPEEDQLSTTLSFQSQFDAYKKANQMFADAVNEHYQEGDVVWCHDYHLMFLPRYLKALNSKMKVGWFLHTPFPSSEIYRMLPSRSELLRSVLAADLVGFHTYDYARHFVSACTRILGLEGTPEGVEDQGKLTHVAAFPVGIDPDRFIHTLELPQVQQHIKELKERFAGRKVMLGVDRLDMIKGIPQKILAFEKFLEENPSWRDKVVLLQLAAPSRTDVPEYQKLKGHVHEIVGRINGRFGTLTSVPIHHLDQSIDFHELCALYAVTDVALVTSIRDGMNLVSYEFAACQASKKGVLILSEFAGAAQSLGAGAILVNPWNIIEVAASFRYALDMAADEREKRHRHNFNYVITHTAQAWAETFISELNDTIVKAQLRTAQVPPLLPTNNAIDCYLQSNNRLVILGFSSTLTEPVDSQGRGLDQIKEMELKLHPKLKEPLKRLCDDPKTTVVVLSGSKRDILDNNFGDYNMCLAAENGSFLRFTTGEWVTAVPDNLNMDWVESVKHVFEYFTERTPRSYFELRETSLVWNYKYADTEFGRLQARDLLQYLWTGPISNAAVEVVQGRRSVEVRAIGVSKGAAIERILREIVQNKGMKEPIDYVLCIGNFLRKDEDIFKFFEPAASEASDKAKTSVSDNQEKITGNQKVGDHGQHEMTVLHEEDSLILTLKSERYFSCAVGKKRSDARFFLGSGNDLIMLLEKLANSS